MVLFNQSQGQSVTANSFRHMMLKEGGVFSVIKEKLSWFDNIDVVIQQDNAPPHKGGNNLEVLNTAGQEGGGIKIKVIQQPARSPDLNKLDLAFFNSLNKIVLSYKYRQGNLAQLIENVQTAFTDYDSKKLTSVNGLLYSIYREVLVNNGSIHYKVPHTHVRYRMRHDEDPADLSVDQTVVANAINFVNNN